MEHSMTEVLARTKPKDSFTLVVALNELKVIYAEITRIRGNSDITILPNVNRLQCILTVVEAKCKVSFDVPNFVASVLGFKRDIIYGVGRHASERLVNIMSVNSILVH